MSKESLPYFASNAELPDYLATLLSSTNFELTPFTIGEKVTASFLLLFSPIWQHDHFISCDENWKKYLQHEHPTVRLLTVGTIAEKHPNYIDILQPPTDFENFLNQAYTADQEWTPIYTGGSDVNEKLKRFLEGHGTDSVIQIFASLKTDIKIINRNLAEGDSLQNIKKEYYGFPKFVEGWATFRNRFSNYLPHFECLPFFSLFKKINIFSEEINPFFADNCRSEALFHELSIPDKIATIQQILRKIKQYAH